MHLCVLPVCVLGCCVFDIELYGALCFGDEFLWVSSFANISSHSRLRCLSFGVSFVVQMLLWLTAYCFLIFGLFFIHLRGVSRKTFLQFMLLYVLAMAPQDFINPDI